MNSNAMWVEINKIREKICKKTKQNPIADKSLKKDEKKKIPKNKPNFKKFKKIFPKLKK